MLNIFYKNAFLKSDLIKNGYNQAVFVAAEHADKALTYVLAAEILDATLENTNKQHLSIGAKAGIIAPVLIVLFLVVNARLRAQALNKVNCRLNDESSLVTRNTRNTYKAYELGIGTLLQLPYIIIDFAFQTLHEGAAKDYSQMAYMVTIITLASINISTNALLSCTVNSIQNDNPANQPNTAVILDAHLLDNSQTTSAAINYSEVKKFLILDSLRTLIAIFGIGMKYHFEDRSPLYYFLGVGLISVIFMQKDFPAAHIVYKTMLNDPWQDMFKPGISAAITKARAQNGLASTNVAIDSGSGYLPGVEELFGVGTGSPTKELFSQTR